MAQVPPNLDWLAKLAVAEIRQRRSIEVAFVAFGKDGLCQRASDL